MKSRVSRIVLSTLMVAVVTIGTSGISFGPTVKGSQGYVSLTIAQAQVSAEPPVLDTSPPSLDIRFEPSGTHVDTKGNLKIRLDFYPGPEDQSYASQHVEVVDTESPEYLDGYKGEVDKDGNPVDVKDYQTWLDSLPKKWVTNPTLSHFLTVKPDITRAEIDGLILSLFSGSVTSTIDDAMSQANSAHLISPYMGNKSSTTSVKMWDDTTAMTPILTDLVTKGAIEARKAGITAAKNDPATKLKVEGAIVSDINTRLSGLSTGGEGGGRIEEIAPQSIDVGSGAVNGNDVLNATNVDKANPANAGGTLDTVEIWASTNLSNCEAATFYVVSGNNLSTRDYQTIGSVTAGSKQTFTGLSIDVLTGDYIGEYASSGLIEATSSGGSGIWQGSGDRIPCTNSAFSSYSDYKVSIYATGTEPTPSLANTPTSKAFGVVAASTTYYADGGAPSNPVTDGDCTFTITNNGSVQIDTTIKATNFTGGVGWALTSGSPGSNTVRLTAYYSGQNPASGVVLTTSDQAFYQNLAAAGTIKWDFKFETGTFTDGTGKTSTITITAAAG